MLLAMMVAARCILPYREMTEKSTIFCKPMVLIPLCLIRSGIARCFCHALELEYGCTVEQLLASDVDLNGPDERGVTPLYLSVFLGQTKVIDSLLDKGIDPNTVSVVPVLYRHQTPDVLLGNGVDPNTVVKYLRLTDASVSVCPFAASSRRCKRLCESHRSFAVRWRQSECDM